jgi:ribosomal protein S25
MEELSKELKKLIEKHLTPEGFEFDINEVDNLTGKERVAGAYLRSELLNNPYEAIEKIYKVYYEKYFQYKPININIIGLETLRSRTIITKSEDWGEFKDKLCIFRGDLAGIIKHKVRRPILMVHKCEYYTKKGEREGCGYEVIRLYEPIENSQDYKIKCPECGKEMKTMEPLFKDEEREPVKLERDLTIAIIQLKETDEVYRVYLPYTPEINNMRDVEIVGILKTNHKGEYYIEGLSINPQKTINFNYDAFVKKVKDAGYDNALDYIKDKVFYEIKAILDKEGKNPTIDTLITLEILASAHIYWDKNRDGHLKPETIDCLFIGSYGQGKSLTIEPLAKLHNTTEDMIRVDMPNIENLIGLVISRDNLKFYKKGIIPMNHNRPIFIEEMIDFILRVGNDIDLLKAGKTSGIWKREREGYNIPMIGVSPWIGVGNIKDIDLMELWEIYHLKGFEEFKEALINYYTKKLLKQHDYNREEAKEHAKKIVDNILGINPQLEALEWLLSQILDFTLRNLRGMTDRIPLIYLLKPYTNEDWREIKLHTYKVKKLREDYNFIRQKNLEAYECSLFISYIKNRDIEFREDALTTLWEIEERLRDLLRDNGLLKGYSDRLFNQIEYMAKAYAKLRFKNYVELEDVRDALKTWFKTILGVLLRIKAPNKVKELFELVGEDAEETPQKEKDEELEEINKLIEESRRLSQLKREILNYMLQHPERTYTTVEIAEKFNISEETAERLLKELCNSGDLYNPEENLWRPL